MMNDVPPPPAPIAIPQFLQPPVTIPQSIFDGFGGNWRWASLDYRGVARVHTFEPHFTATGRIEMPRFKANSEPREAMSMGELPEGWMPLKMLRVVASPYFTDRFGALLPTGADPVEAADVVETVGNNPTAVLTDGIDNPKYKIARTERCRCNISSEQLAQIISRELNIDIDDDGPFCLYASNEGAGTVALTVEWERALS